MKNMPRWFYCICWFSVAISQLYIWLMYFALVIGWLVILHFSPSQDSYFTEVLAVVGTILFFAYHTFSIESGFFNQSSEIFRLHSITNYLVIKFGYEHSDFYQTVYVDPQGDIQLFHDMKELARMKEGDGVKEIFCGSDWSKIESEENEPSESQKNS